MTAADRENLRARLLALRQDALQQLTAALPIIDGGLMRIVADTSATLAAIAQQEETENG